MAKSRKSKTAKTAKPADETAVVTQDVEAIEEAEIVDEVESAPEEPAPDTGVTEDAVSDGPVESLSEEMAEIADAEIAEVVDPEPTDDTAASEPDPEPASEPEPAPVPAKKSSGGGGLMLVLGGLLAGGIGYGVSEFTKTGNGTAQVSAQADQIAALQERLDALESPDLSAVEAQVASGVAATTELSDQMAAFEERLTSVERQPNADGTLSDTALAAYRSELDALRAELDEQQSAVMSAASQAGADLAAARAEAERLEQEALAAAEAAQMRAAINRIATAVETGAPFADSLGDLNADAPAALSDAADTGVATTAQLVADFPAAARSALAVARSEGVSDDAGGLGGFLRNQFDVRSTTPQEGPGPDAVLSRAEAAVKEGRVADALAEIEALPEVVRADLTDWTARAEERANVLDAIAALSETYQ